MDAPFAHVFFTSSSQITNCTTNSKGNILRNQTCPVFHCPQNHTIRHRLNKSTDFPLTWTKVDNKPLKLQMGVSCATFFLAPFLEKTADFVVPDYNNLRLKTETEIEDIREPV